MEEGFSPGAPNRVQIFLSPTNANILALAINRNAPDYSDIFAMPGEIPHPR